MRAVWHSPIMDLVAAAAAWRRDGFVVLPGYLSGPELELARAGLSAIYPTAGDYHADPSSARNHIYTGDEYGGVIPSPVSVGSALQDSRAREGDRIRRGSVRGRGTFGSTPQSCGRSTPVPRPTSRSIIGTPEPHTTGTVERRPVARTRDVHLAERSDRGTWSDPPRTTGGHCRPLGPATGPTRAGKARRSTNKRSRGRVQRERLSPTAPTPFTGQRSCVHPTPTDSASTPATAMPTTPGPPATPGATGRFIRIGRPLWNRQPCANFFSSGFLPPAIPTGPRRPWRVLPVGIRSRCQAVARPPATRGLMEEPIGGKGCRFALVIRGKRRNR